jgi:hypothetical protein
MMTICNNRYITVLFASLCAIAITGHNLMAQNTNKFSVRINAGPALALGQLASQHYNTGGYALSGISAVMEGIWYFRPELGVGIAVSTTSFPFADGAYAHDMVNSDPFMETLYLKSDAYKVRALTAGLYYCKQIAGKFSATGKLAGGLLWAQTPDHLFSASYFTVPNFAFKITPSHSTTSTFQSGLALQYKLFDHVELSLIADYTLAVPAFGFHSSTNSYVKKITFSYLNTMMGIDFRF